jgi:hypothetical protein
MNAYSIFVTPPRGWPVRHEFHAHTAEQAASIASDLFPGCTYSLPRDVTPPGYVVAFIDSVSGACLDRMPA